jgi:hypothetical protein
VFLDLLLYGLILLTVLPSCFNILQVNASVDVYAYGIIMWELFTGQRPYGNMRQQKVVEDVVLRGLRPRFPAGTPQAYASLAAACWSSTPSSRPSFAEVITGLQVRVESDIGN